MRSFEITDRPESEKIVIEKKVENEVKDNSYLFREGATGEGFGDQNWYIYRREYGYVFLKLS